MEDKRNRIKKSLRLAMIFSGKKLNNLDLAIEDINNHFQHVEIKFIELAIKEGSLGYYGEVDKLSIQIICIWINKSIEKYRSNFI